MFFCRMYISESDWGLTYDEDNAEMTYKQYMADPDSEIISIRKDNIMVAGAVVCVDRFAHKEPFGYLVKFYVLNPYRNGRISIALLNKCNDWFKEKGTVADFANAIGKIGNPDVAYRLLNKVGYNKKLRTLYRDNNGNF